MALKNYDIIIIGGGIAGLNCALKLFNLNLNILLLDERDYYGGRILTYYEKNYHYELGAGRFNDNHKNLLNLIDQFNLTKIKHTGKTDFIGKDKIIRNYKLFNTFMKKIINKFKKIKSNILKKYTFKELCLKYYNKKLVKTLIKYFGYRSEFEILNAYDAIKTFKKNFTNNIQYYSLKEGFSELCLRIKNECEKNNIKLKLNSRVLDINFNNNCYKIDLENKSYYCKNIIFALKQKDLLQFKILNSIRNNLESVKSAQLLRIYAYYPLIDNKVWFCDINKTITDSKLKFIIPINKKYGIIMISYTDYNDTKQFILDYKLKKKDVIINIINKELKKIFDFDIPNPIKINSYYWINGCHYWKKKYDSDIISNNLINPIKNIYICGEAFSQNQAWIEGALETSNKVVDKIITNYKNIHNKYT